MDASTALVLILAAGLDTTAVADSQPHGNDAPDPTQVATSPSPGPQVLAGLSRLALPKVRVRSGRADYVLRAPRFEPGGIGWESADGFPRRRPAVVSGADWDSVPPPSNPLPWREGMHLEAASSRPGAGAGFGMLLGGAGGGLLGGLYAGWSSQSVEVGYLGLVLGAIGGGFLGQQLGHALLDPGPRWEPIAGASPVPLEAPHATGPGEARGAGAASGAADRPDALALAGLAARTSGRVRVHAGGRRYELVGPDFGADGLDYRRAVGFPRARPALFAGSDWDSVPPPPHPIPWESIERIDRSRDEIGLGAMLGGAGGAAFGYLVAGVLMMESSVSGSEWQLLTISGGVAGGIMGGVLGHAMFDPGPRWEAVYLPMRR